MITSADNARLVYRDELGNMHEQPLTDIVYAGTLIDPESGNDMAPEYVRVTVTLPADKVNLIYRDSTGDTHEQLISEIVYTGTLIDPETGDDMAPELVETPYVLHIPKTAERNTNHAHLQR